MQTDQNQNQPATITTRGQATYCPEDNKLRLYVGRVPRPEYDRLRAEGWTSTPKQSEAGKGEFAATWTPQRRDTALEFADIIEDEDAGPAERAADRAERFSGYRDKRTAEATGHADRFDAGPRAHGFQNPDRAERAAARHDRIAGRAVDAWDRADYWQRRTAGVIAHALYVSTPAVRMGRIKELEADLRRAEKNQAEHVERYEAWRTIAGLTDPAKQTDIARRFIAAEWGEIRHPVTGAPVEAYKLAEDETLTGAQIAGAWLAGHHAPESPDFQETSVSQWIRHYKLRLAYENQMLEAQGGRAAFVEMVPGGFIGSHQIQKVNKSNATGRVVSVQVWGTHTGYTKESGYTQQATRPCLVTLNIERLAANAYRPPTDAELAAFHAKKKADKAAAPKKSAPPLVNPTDADAERLQALFNAAHVARLDDYDRRHFTPAEVCRVTQATYSENSRGAHAKAETYGIRAGGVVTSKSNLWNSTQAKREQDAGPELCKVRLTGYSPRRVVVLTDKPQNPLPAALWKTPTPAETVHA
jgi:hypothetical protein